MHFPLAPLETQDAIEAGLTPVTGVITETNQPGSETYTGGRMCKRCGKVRVLQEIEKCPICTASLRGRKGKGASQAGSISLMSDTFTRVCIACHETGQERKVLVPQFMGRIVTVGMPCALLCMTTLHGLMVVSPYPVYPAVPLLRPLPISSRHRRGETPSDQDGLMFHRLVLSASALGSPYLQGPGWLSLQLCLLLSLCVGQGDIAAGVGWGSEGQEEVETVDSVSLRQTGLSVIMNTGASVKVHGTLSRALGKACNDMEPPVFPFGKVMSALDGVGSILPRVQQVDRKKFCVVHSVVNGYPPRVCLVPYLDTLTSQVRKQICALASTSIVDVDTGGGAILQASTCACVWGVVQKASAYESLAPSFYLVGAYLGPSESCLTPEAIVSSHTASEAPEVWTATLARLGMVRSTPPGETPEVPERVAERLFAYFHMARLSFGMGPEGSYIVTTRDLSTLKKLAVASCRLWLRDTLTEYDVTVAAVVWESSLSLLHHRESPCGLMAEGGGHEGWPMSVLGATHEEQYRTFTHTMDHQIEEARRQIPAETEGAGEWGYGSESEEGY
ncbi:hypothetical protein KIPB_008569 [Kipferlia bialata]|uniref:Uncharacterized protein n=1 Tax=Kipferlia bialata TaxID=797122 RepID=A0A9K3GGR5_9EUKA|nr:hypothetical protein KIPB_004677 [Kipferlia bialata]GIQ86674.1 hypothetical protein KIPB_008569 [Kipferlia bialata]|eukprot:g4677.t1